MLLVALCTLSSSTLHLLAHSFLSLECVHQLQLLVLDLDYVQLVGQLGGVLLQLLVLLL